METEKRVHQDDSGDEEEHPYVLIEDNSGKQMLTRLTPNKFAYQKDPLEQQAHFDDH